MKRIALFLIEQRHKIGFLLFIAYCFFIVYYTLLCREIGDKHRTELRFMWAYREMLSGNPKWRNYVWQNICNILFFTPFGFLIPKKLFYNPSNVLNKKRWLSIIIGILFSIFIEFTQYVTCRGLCELDDVICNGFGSLSGYLLYVKVMQSKVIQRSLKVGKNESNIKRNRN